MRTMLRNHSLSASSTHMDQAAFTTRTCMGGWRLPLHQECSNNPIRAGRLESPSIPPSDGPTTGEKQLNVHHLDNRDGISLPGSITGLDQDQEGRESIPESPQMGKSVGREESSETYFHPGWGVLEIRTIRTFPLGMGAFTIWVHWTWERKAWFKGWGSLIPPELCHQPCRSRLHHRARSGCTEARLSHTPSNGWKHERLVGSMPGTYLPIGLHLPRTFWSQDQELRSQLPQRPGQDLTLTPGQQAGQHRRCHPSPGLRTVSLPRAPFQEFSITRTKVLFRRNGAACCSTTSHAPCGMLITSAMGEDTSSGCGGGRGGLKFQTISRQLGK